MSDLDIVIALITKYESSIFHESYYYNAPWVHRPTICSRVSSLIKGTNQHKRESLGFRIHGSEAGNRILRPVMGSQITVA